MSTHPVRECAVVGEQPEVVAALREPIVRDPGTTAFFFVTRAQG